MKHSKKHLYWIIPLAVLVVLAALGLWLYSGKANAAKTSVIKTFRLPIARVDGSFITMAAMEKRLNVAERVSPQATDQGLRQQVFTSLIDSKVAESIAERRDIKITDKDIEAEFATFPNEEQSSEQIAAALKEQYGLSIDDFKSLIVRSEVVNAKLATWFNGNQNLNKDQYKLAESIIAKLDGGEGFDALANTYSDDEASKQLSGDEGIVSEKTILPELAERLRKAGKGDRVIASSRSGLHIIELYDVTTAENGERSYGIKQVFLKQKAFVDWYAKEKSVINQKIYVSF